MQNKKELIEARTLSGFRDILPDMALVKEDMLNNIKKVFRSFGFVPIETPHLEYAEVLVGKGSDEIQKELYRFNDHGNRDVALRFDQTVPLARFVVQHQNELALPFKRYAIGNVFRGERAQAGRYREFTQCDFDYIGTTSLSADAEIVQVIHNSLKSLGIENFTILINNRKILNGLAEYLNVEDSIESILRIVDKIDKIGAENVAKSLKDELGLSDKIIEEIMNFVALKQDDTLGEFFKIIQKYKSYNETMKSGIEDLEYIFNLLQKLNIDSNRYRVDFSIARGLTYYTGIVYETILNDSKIGSVCSGGRFDDLTKSFSNENLQGVGASIGIDRLIAGLEQLKIIDTKSTPAKVLIANMDKRFISDIYQIGEELRELNINVEVYPDVVKMKKQFNYANKKGHKFMILMGENEINNSVIAIKDLESGEQKEFKDIQEVALYMKD